MYTINLENVRFSSDIKFSYKQSSVFTHPVPECDDTEITSKSVCVPVKCELFFYNKKAELINYDRYNSINVVV